MQATAINRLSARAPWWLVVGIALCASLAVSSPAAAASGADRPAAGIVHGWKAGPVARGTGFRTTGGSKRVREVQRSLDRLGYAPGPVDGLFGPLTDSAVRRYQSDRELTADGIVGSTTLASLRARTETGRNTSKPVERSSRARAGAATSAAAASPPERPQVGKPVSQSDGLEGLPSWWMLALIVPFAFSAAVAAALILMRAVGLTQAGTAALRRRVMRRRRREWADHPASGAVHVEGRSPDPRVGRFSGFAYWMWPVQGAEAGDSEPTLLVYDSTKPGPVPAQAEDVTAVNGRAIEPAPGRVQPRRPAFRWVGARVHLAEQDGVDSLPGTLPVDLELFAEGEHDRWEAGRVNRRPLHVRMDDLQDSLERVVMTDRISELAAALDRRGVPMEVDELRQLPFALELTPAVEYALAEREVTHARAG